MFGPSVGGFLSHKPTPPPRHAGRDCESPVTSGHIDCEPPPAVPPPLVGSGPEPASPPVQASVPEGRVRSNHASWMFCAVLRGPLHQPKVPDPRTAAIENSRSWVQVPRLHGHGSKRVCQLVLPNPTAEVLNVLFIEFVPVVSPRPSETSDPPPRHNGQSRLVSNFCRNRSCSERVHPECSSWRWTLHCTSARCSFHSPPNGTEAAIG